METICLSHNLPAALTPCIGRDAETAYMLQRLRDPQCRLLTITGPGGVGKTRLAFQVAQCLVDENAQTLFPHGVYVVPLAAYSARESLDELLATALLSTLNLHLDGADSAATQLRQYLHNKRMLLLLDNFEHVVNAASFVATLLRDAPDLTIMVTSRERLHVRGEWIVALDGLAFPSRDEALQGTPESYSAVMLFTNTARSHMSDFALSAEILPAVIRICALCAGLPLAIELAASWTRLLSCDEIAAEIAHSRDFLASAMHDLPPRQQSMRAVFESSWNLLTATEQHALRRVAILRGSFSRQAAAAIAGVALPMLAALIDKSLVRRVSERAGSAARYEIAEVLRQYAAEQLDRTGETAELAARHADFYLAWLASLLDGLRGAKQQMALLAISDDMEHIRTAWRWACAAADPQALRRAAASLFHVYDMRSWFGEGSEMFQLACEALEPQQQNSAVAVGYANLLARQGWFTFHRGHWREARDMLQRSLDLLRAQHAQADQVFVLNYLAAVCAYGGEYDRARMLGEESLTLTAALGDQYGRAVAYNVLGQADYDQGRYETAQFYSQQSLQIEQQLGNQWSMAFSLTNLGKVAYITGSYAEARWFFNESLQIRQALNDIRGVAICFGRLGETAVALGDIAEARDRYSQSLAMFRTIGNQWGVVASLTDLGQLALVQDEATAALPLLQTALREALGIESLPQIVTLLATSAPLIRRRGHAEWATTLEQLLASANTELLAYTAQVQRLLAWNGDAAPQAVPEHAAASIATPHPASRLARESYPAGLTAREVEVLRLVADGLTDAQVAERLVLSTRTVSTHLSSIYGKLQVNSRSAATRFAVENRLT